MFVDVGRVEDGEPEYLTWQELETVPVERALAAAAPLGSRSPADPVRPRSGRLRPLLRLRGGGRGLRRLAGAGALGHRLGPGHARRPHSRLPPARVRSPVRQLRPGRHQRPADPRRPARLADRGATTPSSPRTGTPWRTRAADSRSAGSRSRAPSAAATSTPSCSRAAPRSRTTRYRSGPRPSHRQRLARERKTLRKQAASGAHLFARAARTRRSTQ